MPTHRDNNVRLKGFARVMRHESTDAEALLWSKLRNDQLNGHKFRRQVPIAGFIVDFYCLKNQLAIELDGDQHGDLDAKNYDARRSAILSNLGIRVIRFPSSNVLKDTDAVLRTILRELTSPTI
jgi:very-short-patch-repair endonuclease